MYIGSGAIMRLSLKGQSLICLIQRSGLLSRGRTLFNIATLLLFYEMYHYK